MAVEAQKYYLTDTDHDDTWGTDIRKLDDTNGSALTTTICQHPSAQGTTSITVDPYTSIATQSDIRDTKGWAINLSGADGMESTATDKRIIPAGTWSFQQRITIPSGGLLTGSHNVTISWRVYRVSSSDVRTTLFTTTAAEQAGGNGGGTFNVTATSASQPEIVLESGETIHVGILSTDRQVQGTLGGTTAGNITYRTGDGSPNESFVQVPSPGIRTRHLRTHSFIATIDAFLVRKTKTTRATSGKGIVNLVRQTKKPLAIVATGISTVIRYIRTTKTTSGKGIATVVRKISTTKSTSVRGFVTLIRKTKKLLSVSGRGISTVTLHLTLFRTLQSAGRGIVTVVRKTKTTKITTASGHVTVIRRTKKVLLSSGRGIVTITRKTKKTLTTRSSALVSVIRKTLKPLIVSTSGIVSMTRLMRFHRTLETAARGIVKGLVKIPFEKVPGDGGGGGVDSVTYQVTHNECYDLSDIYTLLGGHDDISVSDFSGLTDSFSLLQEGGNSYSSHNEETVSLTDSYTVSGGHDEILQSDSAGLIDTFSTELNGGQVYFLDICDGMDMDESEESLGGRDEVLQVDTFLLCDSVYITRTTPGGGGGGSDGETTVVYYNDSLSLVDNIGITRQPVKTDFTDLTDTVNVDFNPQQTFTITVTDISGLTESSFVVETDPLTTTTYGGPAHKWNTTSPTHKWSDDLVE